MLNFSFENPDKRIRGYSLRLERELADIPDYSLPEGFRFVFYSEGDRDTWIDIEISAGEAPDYPTGLEYWNEYFEPHKSELPGRMLFIENAEGLKVGTASAYYDISGEDTEGNAWLHWVSIRPEFQGRGLSKPLITEAMRVMRSLGYSHCIIPTHTEVWIACRLYLSLGFRPTAKNAAESEYGWRIIRSITDHPALSAFEPLSLDEVLKEE